MGHLLPGLLPVGIGDVDNGSLAVRVHCEQKRQKLERQRERLRPRPPEKLRHPLRRVPTRRSPLWHSPGICKRFSPAREKSVQGLRPRWDSSWAAQTLLPYLKDPNMPSRSAAKPPKPTPSCHPLPEPRDGPRSSSEPSFPFLGGLW